MDKLRKQVGNRLKNLAQSQLGVMMKMLTAISIAFKGVGAGREEGIYHLRFHLCKSKAQSLVSSKDSIGKKLF